MTEQLAPRAKTLTEAIAQTEKLPQLARRGIQDVHYAYRRGVHGEYFPGRGVIRLGPTGMTPRTVHHEMAHGVQDLYGDYAGEIGELVSQAQRSRGMGQRILRAVEEQEGGPVGTVHGMAADEIQATKLAQHLSEALKRGMPSQTPIEYLRAFKKTLREALEESSVAQRGMIDAYKLKGVEPFYPLFP